MRVTISFDADITEWWLKVIEITRRHGSMAFIGYHERNKIIRRVYEIKELTPEELLMLAFWFDVKEKTLFDNTVPVRVGIQ